MIYKFDGENIPADKLPVPAGWRLLVGKIQKPDVTSGGIILPDEVQKYMEAGSTVVKVLSVGDIAYQEDKFKGAGNDLKQFCSVGDIVVIGKFVGQRIGIEDNGNIVDLKFLNDDEVIAKIPDLSIIEI